MQKKESPRKGGRQSDCGRYSTTPPAAPPDFEQASRYDFDQIDAALLPRAESLLSEWLPDGKLSGNEYTALNPTRADTRPGSFKINTGSGIWEDFATGDKGPGLVSLFAYVNRMDRPDAAAELAQWYGLQTASARDKPPPKARPRDEWQPVMPVPDDAPPPPTYAAKPGETVTRYDYRGNDGRLLHLVYRVDRAGPAGKKGKDFLPVTWCNHKVTGAHDWRWKAIPDKRPLYGLETLTEDTVGFPACISEGEKAVQAARQLMPGFVCLTSSGGSKAAGKADWTPLIGRRVVIWPDGDKAGTDYAMIVARELRKVGVTDVHLINVSAVFGTGVKEGFDAADALARGWTAERLGKALAADDALLPAEEDDEPAAGLPTIRSIPGNLDKVIRNAERVLIDSGIPVFDRGGQVVRPVMLMADVPMDGGTLPAGSLAIMDVSAGWLTLTWNRIAAWYAKARDSFKRIDCPSKYATLYLDAAGMWTLPVLTGIVEAPTIRPDGTLLIQPGYDPRSGLYLDYTGLPVTAPEYPTKADALAALAVLKHVIREFPFVSDAARSVALSSQITAAVRRALRTAPFHVFDSPEKGTGKGLLANIASIIATGRQPTTATLATSPDENQKKLESYLVRGVSFLNIDNVSKPVEGDLLCSLATEETVAPRILGQTKFVTVRTNTMTVTITGNNLVIAGDLTRRALVSRIDAQMERPDARSFKIPDLKRYVAEHRHELIAACLTIVRAYIVAGYPPHGKAPYGSFPDWDRWIRGALIWLGEADPLETRERIIEVDSVGSALGALLKAWVALFGTEPLTSKELAARSEPPAPSFDLHDGGDADELEEQRQAREALREALLEVAGTKEGKVNTRSLGDYLRANTDRVTRGLRLESAGTFGTRKRWKVRAIARIQNGPQQTAQTALLTALSSVGGVQLAVQFVQFVQLFRDDFKIM